MISVGIYSSFLHFSDFCDRTTWLSTGTKFESVTLVFIRSLAVVQSRYGEFYQILSSFTGEGEFHVLGFNEAIHLTELLPEIIGEEEFEEL